MLRAFSILRLLRFPDAASLDSGEHRITIFFSVAAIFFLSASCTQAQHKPDHLCHKLEFEAEVSQNSEWHASIGQNWLARLVPIGPFNPGFSGWDIAVSPAADQNYPDALLLAMPPYGSLNSREIATTYAMRAQDAIAWSPRHFHFFTSAADLEHSRQLYKVLRDPESDAATKQRAASQLLDLSADADRIATGRLDVLDAHLVSGTADPAPFAAQWAAGLARIPHTLDHVESPTATGSLHSLRFRLTLWLPATWKAAETAGKLAVKCAE